MQLLLLDIMLFTLVTIASAHFNFEVARDSRFPGREGKVFTRFFWGNERMEYTYQSRAIANNCAALFGRCEGIRCCGNYELSIPGSPAPQIPPWMHYTIKCSAALETVMPDGLPQIQYSKFSYVYGLIHKYAGIKDARYYAKKSTYDRYCLPYGRLSLLRGPGHN